MKRLVFFVIFNYSKKDNLNLLKFCVCIEVGMNSSSCVTVDIVLHT